MHTVIDHWTDRELVDELLRIKPARPQGGRVHPWILESDFVADLAKKVIHYNQQLSPAMRAKAEEMLGDK